MGEQQQIQWTNYFLPSQFVPLDEGHIAASDLAKRIEEHEGSEAHHCVFDLEPRSSFTKYSGLTRPALGMIFFDFDSESDKGIAALADARTLIDFIGVKDYALFYSGYKGFVVGVPAGYFGLLPSADVPEKCAHIANTIKEMCPTLDCSIYGANHKLRAFGTRHPKSGHFRIQFIGDLKEKVARGEVPFEEIHKMATEGRGHLSLDHLDLNKKREPLEKFLKILESYQRSDESDQEFNNMDEPAYVVDAEAIQNGCEVLKYAKTFPDKVSEPLWYAVLSVVGRLPNGDNLAHDYSKGHPDYSRSETEEKLKKAIESSKPRTCKSIGQHAGNLCGSCKFNRKVKSPISIQGPNFIRTQQSGFHRTVDKKKYPAYDDLLKFFDRKHSHVSLVPGKIVYAFNGNHYEEITDTELQAFAQNNFRPFAKSTMTREFSSLVLRTNIKRVQWFEDSTLRKMNFLNGVLDIDTMKFSEGHSPTLGFRNVLNFKYDPTAKSPMFDKFLSEVIDGDKARQMNLLEYMGYSISNDHCYADKVLLLTGEGSNGKSRYLNILNALGGHGAISLAANELKDKFKRQILDGALFCVMEELPPFSDIMFWEDIKALASGKKITVEKKQKDPYSIANKTKFIMTCNELPPGTSPTHGFFRKLLIVPFTKNFSAEQGNKIHNIDQLIIEQEISGVMNRVLEGYRRLKDQKYEFTKSAATDAALAAYRLMTDSVHRWLEEHVEILSEGAEVQGVRVLPNHPWLKKGPYDKYFAVVPLMFADYLKWCEGQNEKPVTATKFTMRLKKLLPENRMQERKIDGKKVNSISGVSFWGSSDSVS